MKKIANLKKKISSKKTNFLSVKGGKIPLSLDASLAVIIAGGLAIRNPVIIRKTSANALIQ
jgi:hypothetical protein